jgi:D-alanyl-D-alanine carboxypeptidase
MRAERIFFSLIAISVLLIGCADDEIIINQHDKLQISLQQMIDTALSEYKEKVPDYPGGIALKVIYGKETFFVASGMGTSVNGQIHFRAASCTKTFTATAILLLHQQGKLNINDHITDTIPGTSETYVPDIPAYNIPNKNSITILDLLRHRAGVFDISNDDIPDTISAPVPYKGMNYLTYKMTTDASHTFNFDELVQVVAETGLSYFTPGTGYHYSNTGYSILGKIIERVSQQSYRDYLMENVILPMGMLNSFMPVLGSDQEIPEPNMPGYVLYNHEVYNVTNSNISANVAEGNLITSPDDLSLFLSKLLSGNGVLNFNTVNSLMMNYLPTGGIGAGGYGCGLSYTNNLGYGHSGAHEGYLSLMAYDPEIDFTVVAFTNTWNLNEDMNSLVYQLINLLENSCYKSKAIIQNRE